jgi:hypothetical protein
MEVNEKTRQNSHKLMIVGLDGATWSVIDPLIQEGKLPHLARLIREGARGVLRSLDPMISTMLWTCISSGKQPDDHGVRDFAVSSTAVRCKRLWDIFESEGYSVGVYGHLITWPPDAVDGFMVPGAFALGPETHPPELAFLRQLAMEEVSGKQRRLRDSFGYAWKGWRHGVRLRTLWGLGAHLVLSALGRVEPQMDFYRKRLLKLWVDTDVFCRLMRTYRPQFSFFYTHLLDSTQHLFWKYHQPEPFGELPRKDLDRYGGIVTQAYQQADRALGRMMDAAGPETTVMVISDHGAQAAEEAVEGAAWTIKTENLLKMLGLWGRVSAVNIGFHLYLSPRVECPEAKEKLIEVFRNIVEEKNGRPLFEVIPMEHSYLKVMVPEERLERFKGATIRVGEQRCRFEDVVEISTGRLSGAHHPEAICILWGRQIRKGVRLQPGSLLDVTPTALMLMGLPVADDMSGRPLTEAVTEAYRTSCPQDRCQTYEDQQKTEGEDTQGESMPEDLVKQLKALGYLG